MRNPIFKFKSFEIKQANTAMKVGTDGVLLGAWHNVNDAKTILDIGTGTGVIALMAAQRNTTAQVTAIDIDTTAVEEATYNAENSPFGERVTCTESAIQTFSDNTTTQFDAIVCNPPFFTGGTLSQNMSRDTARHTAKLSHNELLRSVRKLLAPTGKFSVVLPYIEGLQFIDIAKTYNFQANRVCHVRPKVDKKIERILIELVKTPCETKEETLVIQHDERNDYTADYIALTKDFYLAM